VTARRIVVALDARTRPGELEAAAALAGGVGAELLGLFIEDLDLLHFAALPFAHEIGIASAARRPLDRTALERTLQAQAAQVERELAAAARRSAASWAFRVARGLAAEELIAATVSAHGGGLQLLLLGDGDSPATRWAEAARRRLAESDAGLRVELVLAADVAALDAALQTGEPGVVVLRAGQSVLSEPALRELLQQSAAPVLVLPARFSR
jgi:hypothetical protein